ncbi:hypothetical protein ACQEWB_26205 [Streptomyces sp. CA-249302]|uniref:hypothetical protein n=1 Tax=Streptomyces sp. CA-249302 TaxID=3240058 RepID=UPI003D8F8FF2
MTSYHQILVASLSRFMNSFAALNIPFASQSSSAMSRTREVCATAPSPVSACRTDPAAAIDRSPDAFDSPGLIRP